MPSPDLLRIWALVEALPVTAHLETEWREMLGNDYGVLLPFLRTETALATTYPCPDPVHEGCPRQVVHHGPEDIVAVCGNASPQCDPLRLTKQDLVIRRLDEASFHRAIVDELRRINGLVSADFSTPEGVLALGRLKQRGVEVPVVWIPRRGGDVEALLPGIRQLAGGEGLIAVLPRKRAFQSDMLLGDRTVLLGPPSADDGYLALSRGLDLLDPAYRRSRASAATGVFDDLRIELAEEPGVRHVVLINGHDFEGFQKSDVKFLRMLVVAAARKQDADVDSGGWIEKFRLQGDNKDHDLEALRTELRSFNIPGLNPAERASLIKASPNRDGKIRLAVAPALIRLDPSLERFQDIGDHKANAPRAIIRSTPGQKAREAAFRQQRGLVRKLLAEARKLGAPVAD